MNGCAQSGRAERLCLARSIGQAGMKRNSAVRDSRTLDDQEGSWAIAPRRASDRVRKCRDGLIDTLPASTSSMKGLRLVADLFEPRSVGYDGGGLDFDFRSLFDEAGDLHNGHRRKVTPHHRA